MTEDEIRRLNQVLEDLPARTAHDLRNALATIKMAVSALPADVDPEVPVREIVERQTDAALIVTDRLVATARASRTPERQPVDVGAVARSAAEGIARLSVDAPQGDPVHADAGALQRALEALFDEAARAGTQHVSVRSDDEDGDWVVTVEGLPRGDRRGAVAVAAAAARAHGGDAEVTDENGSARVTLRIPKAE